jgi:HK97 family phage prohead protease
VAVIKDDDGSVAGCHNSESAARRQMAALYAQEDMNKTMDQINVKAAVAVQTDEGLFEAVISTASVDREKDIVEPSAMVDALKKWNRPIPLAWNHSTDAKDIFGHIEPMTVREVGDEVVAQGQVDLESEMGREAWRSFKSRTVGFSFGYLILGSRERKGGGRHITGLDVFEITATPTPMNNDTRVLSTKELEAEARRVARETIENAVPELKEEVAPPPELADEVKALQDRCLLLERQAAFALAQLENFKGVWTDAYVDGLPDSAFLFVEDGDKDEGGRTVPREKRHGAYKDADGEVDLPHLRFALLQLPDTNLSEEQKGVAADRGRRVLDGSRKSAARPDRDEPSPLRKHAEQVAEELGVPRSAPVGEPDPVDHDAVHRFFRETMKTLPL